MIETRSFAITDVKLQPLDDQTRDVDGNGRLEGYAIMFGAESHDLGGFREIVGSDALTRSLAEAATGNRNIYALWSHDRAQPLGSTRSGKLILTVDSVGLRFSLDTTRFTPMQIDAARDGDLRMSFGFVVRSDTWVEHDDGSVTRTLNDIDLSEVSPVVFPAYPDTSAAVRSLNEWRATREAEEPEAVERIENEETDEVIQKDNSKMNAYLDYRITRLSK